MDRSITVAVGRQGRRERVAPTADRTPLLHDIARAYVRACVAGASSATRTSIAHDVDAAMLASLGRETYDYITYDRAPDWYRSPISVELRELYIKTAK